jgi:hypothetical protein
VAYRNPKWNLAQTWQERGIRWKSGTRPCGTRNNKQTNILSANNNTKVMPFDMEHLEEQFYISYGRCYTWLVPKELHQLRIHFLTLQTFMNSYVFPHHPGQFQHKDTRNKLPIVLGMYFFMSSSHKVRVWLRPGSYFRFCFVFAPNF